jgi:hypothetical protein
MTVGVKLATHCNDSEPSLEAYPANVQGIAVSPDQALSHVMRRIDIKHYRIQDDRCQNIKR